MDGVPVLVQDHLAVLGVVDAALPEAELVLGVVGGEGVVVAQLVDPDRLGPVVDRPPGLAEAEVAGLADHGGVVAVQEPAAVEVGEGNVVVGGRRHGRVGVLPVGQRLVAQRLDRVGDEHRADPGAGPGARLGRRGLVRYCRVDRSC